MKLKLGSFLQSVVLLAAIALAGALLYAFHAAVSEVSRKSASNLAQEVVAGPTRGEPVTESFTPHNGRSVEVTATFDALEGGTVHITWGEQPCVERPVGRTSVSAEVLDGESLTRTWHLCVPSDARTPVTTVRIWYPTAEGDASRPEGELALSEFSRAGGVLFAFAAGECDEQTRTCLAALQVGTTRYPEHLSMSLPSAEDTHRSFTLVKLSPRRGARRASAEEVGEASPADKASTDAEGYEEVEMPEAEGDS